MKKKYKRFIFKIKGKERRYLDFCAERRKVSRKHIIIESLQKLIQNDKEYKR